MKWKCCGRRYHHAKLEISNLQSLLEKAHITVFSQTFQPQTASRLNDYWSPQTPMIFIHIKKRLDIWIPFFVSQMITALVSIKKEHLTWKKKKKSRCCIIILKFGWMGYLISPLFHHSGCSNTGSPAQRYTIGSMPIVVHQLSTHTEE